MIMDAYVAYVRMHGPARLRGLREGPRRGTRWVGGFQERIAVQVPAPPLIHKPISASNGTPG